MLLTLPYSFSQLGILSGVLLQLFYGIVGSWTAYLISVLYIEYRSRKEKENVNFKNHVIQVGDTVLLIRTTTTIDIGLAFKAEYLKLQCPKFLLISY